MQNKNEITITPRRYVAISLSNSNREQFDLFKSKFEALINKAGVNHKPVIYKRSEPYSEVIDSTYADEAIELAKQLPSGLVEISIYDLDEDGDRVPNTTEVLYPEITPEMEDLNRLEEEDQTYDISDDDDATDDDDYDGWGEVTIDSDLAYTTQSETQSESVSEVVAEAPTSTYSEVPSEVYSEVQSKSVVPEVEEIVYSEPVQEVVSYEVPQVSTENSLDDLMPSANDILDDLNPTITDVPIVNNPIVTLTVNQHQSNLYTLYGMLGKALSNVKASDLTAEIERFKHSGSAEYVPEVQNYFATKNKVDSKIDEMNSNVEIIRGSYDKEFENWLQSRIEELKAQYAVDHPNMTEQEVANYLASNKPALDELQAELAKNKDSASQALVRAFSIAQDNEELSDAMRFVMIKDRAKASINAVAEAYKQQDTSLNLEPVQETEHEPIETPTVTPHVVGDDDDDYAFAAQMIAENETPNEDSHEDETESVEESSETPSELDFANMTDEELIAYYNSVQNQEENDTDEAPEVEEETHEPEHVEETNAVPDHVEDMFAVEHMDEPETEQNATVEDGLDVGVTQPVPVISDEDIEEMSRKLEEEQEKLEEDLANKSEKLTQREDDPDALIEGDDDDLDFAVIGEEDVDLDDLDKEVKEDKKAKKAKKGKAEKKPKKQESLDGANEKNKPKSKVGTVIGIGVIGLFIAGGLGLAGMTMFGGGGNKSPKTAQTTKSSDQSAAVKKFFKEAKKYGIDVDKEITVPIDKVNHNVTITALNSDGSITVKEPGSSQNINVPYSIVKQFVDDEKAKTDNEDVESSTTTDKDNGIKTKEGSAPLTGESSSSSSSETPTEASSTAEGSKN